jgi:hypothetical protein
VRPRYERKRISEVPFVRARVVPGSDNTVGHYSEDGVDDVIAQAPAIVRESGPGVVATIRSLVLDIEPEPQEVPAGDGHLCQETDTGLIGPEGLEGPNDIVREYSVGIVFRRGSVVGILAREGHQGDVDGRDPFAIDLPLGVPGPCGR